MLPPNFRRPAIKRISLIPYMYRWNHRVSVLAGSSMTTVAPFSADSAAFCTHFPISRPYGGLHQHTPAHSCTSPSSSGVKYRAHFAFSGIAQTSVSNANSSFSSSKKPCGVAHKSVSLENIKSLFMPYPPCFPQAFARPPPAGTHQVRPRGAARLAAIGQRPLKPAPSPCPQQHVPVDSVRRGAPARRSRALQRGQAVFAQPRLPSVPDSAMWPGSG